MSADTMSRVCFAEPLPVVRGGPWLPGLMVVANQSGRACLTRVMTINEDHPNGTSAVQMGSKGGRSTKTYDMCVARSFGIELEEGPIVGMTVSVHTSAHADHRYWRVHILRPSGRFSYFQIRLAPNSELERNLLL